MAEYQKMLPLNEQTRQNHSFDEAVEQVILECKIRNLSKEMVRWYRNVSLTPSDLTHKVIPDMLDDKLALRWTPATPKKKELWSEFLLRITGVDPTCCEVCTKGHPVRDSPTEQQMAAYIQFHFFNVAKTKKGVWPNQKMECKFRNFSPESIRKYRFGLKKVQQHVRHRMKGRNVIVQRIQRQIKLSQGGKRECQVDFPTPSFMLSVQVSRFCFVAKQTALRRDR